MAYILCLSDFKLSGRFHAGGISHFTGLCPAQHSTQYTSSVYLDSALMDLCLMLGLCYLANVSARASVDFSPRFPRNTFGPGGFILQTAATTSRYASLLQDTVTTSWHMTEQSSSTLLRLKREPPPAINAEIQLLCISQQSYKRWMIS